MYQSELPALSRFELVPPADQLAEGWLSQLDSSPSVVPTWPLSQHMTLVAVVASALPQAESSRAFVLTHPQEIETIATNQRVATRDVLVLFFTVLRQRVIPLTPGLDLAAWRS